MTLYCDYNKQDEDMSLSISVYNWHKLQTDIIPILLLLLWLQQTTPLLPKTKNYLQKKKKEWEQFSSFLRNFLQ